MLIQASPVSDEPCGVFGPGTTSALQTFLKDKGFYRYPVNGK